MKTSARAPSAWDWIAFAVAFLACTPSSGPQVCLAQAEAATEFDSADHADRADSEDSDDSDDDELPSGVVAEYAADDGLAVRRIEPTIAHRAAGDLADPRLEGGDFTVTWRGRLLSQAPGSYRIHVFGAGAVTIRLAGELILEESREAPGWMSSRPLELSFDWHPIEVVYRPSRGSRRLAVYWQGPGFQLEPLDLRRLFHDAKDTATSTLERGRLLARALRCGACHDLADEPAVMSAPALDKLGGALRHGWAQTWLTGEGAPKSFNPSRRMPDFAMPADQAMALSQWLASEPAPRRQNEAPPPATAQAEEIAAGGRLFLTTGCLACHRLGEFGAAGLFAGGDLTHVASKRPPEFFASWLKAPESHNRSHRMPVFQLDDIERRRLAAFLASCGAPAAEDQRNTGGEESDLRAASAASSAAASELFQSWRCGACHEYSPAGPAIKPRRLPIAPASDWRQSCAGEPDPEKKRPGYRLTPDDQKAVRDYVSSLLAARRDADENAARPAAVIDGRWLFVEKNCGACHSRDESPGLGPQLLPLAVADSQFAELVPAMTPPSLASVGDKLHDAALREAIDRSTAPHRPWLLARMPQFRLPAEQLDALVHWLIEEDRIPEPPAGDQAAPRQVPENQLQGDGPRLVTQDGFGCTSCHQVGRVQPPKGPLGARGPDLSQLDRRIRRPWFDRWVRNPARIVPGMEMPSVQVPVRGVLDQDLDLQLEAVWRVLSTPGFEPPEPNPVRIVRRSGSLADEQAIVLTDVLKSSSPDPVRTFIQPLLVALPNRHNVLLDLAENRLAGWWTGDAARQRTKGKSWYWEAGGGSVLPLAAEDENRTELTIAGAGGENLPPNRPGQFMTEADSIEHLDQGVRIRRRLAFAGAEPRQIHLTETVFPAANSKEPASSGFHRRLEIAGLHPAEQVSFRPLGALVAQDAAVADNDRTIVLPKVGNVRLTQSSGRIEIDSRGPILRATADERGLVSFELEYRLDRKGDQFPQVAAPLPPPRPVPLFMVPGYEGVRLPLADELMPTGLCWRPDGKLVITSLKGNVAVASDTNGDGLEDDLRLLNVELASPYGAAAGDGFIDVITKSALVRLHDRDDDLSVERIDTIASGWGHTDDYHDWAVGLVSGAEGEYYIALPCQQDERSAAAARWRGRLLRLAPRTPTADDPRPYHVQPVSAGHRFPMGLARNHLGELFVTDNQGNYNPFNELNHVRAGAHFGFLNAIEKGAQPQSPLVPPAINIPHPWTRSVNGICFLETPPGLAGEGRASAFGPFEGHLIGCEYDTRRLVRMSLEQVGDVVQGAVYPFTVDKPPEGETLVGPVVCAVSPAGDLYIGCLRDSGWGGANNIGAVSRLRPTANPPPGIAEVRARHDGFSIEFTAPVERRLAAQTGNYAVSSFRRLSTPAYGGEDQLRRAEKVLEASVSRDARSVHVRLAEMREGFVYELHLNPLAKGKLFHPAEAYYTLHRRPPAPAR